MADNFSWVPWHKVISLRPDLKSGELSLAQGKWQHTLFYEGLRYDVSPAVHVSPTLALLQPASQSDIFGYRLGYRF